MIKVECVSCAAPYELDERRIPDKGMKMRCPKCGTSFGVTKHGVAPEGGAPAIGAPPPAAIAAPPPPPPIAPPPPAVSPSAFKGTVMGMQAPPLAAPPAIAAPPAPPAAAPPIAPAFAPATTPKHKTAFGVAPAAAAPSEHMPLGALEPPPLAQGPGVPVRAAAPRPATPTAAAAAAPAAANKAAAAKGAFGATMMGVAPQSAAAAVPKPAPAAVPAPAATPAAAPAAAPAAPSFGIDVPKDLPPPLPTVEAQDLSVSRIRVEDLPLPRREVDLPAPRSAADAAADERDLDLPAAKPMPAKPFGGLDLPPAKPKPAAPFGDLDLPAAKPKPAAPFGDLDLPAPKPASTPRSAFDFGEEDDDLPALRDSGVDLPAPRLDADLPTPKQHADLPAPKQLADLPTPKQLTDLPTPKALADLPVAKGLVDLPSPKSLADLPVQKGKLDLPSLKGGTGFGDIELSPPADLPAPRNDLPMPRGDESSFADLDLPDLPDPSAPKATQRGFGDIELPPPKPAANLLPPKARTVQGVPQRAPQRAAASTGQDDERDSFLPPSLLGGEDESSFGDIDLGEEQAKAPARPTAPRAAAPRPATEPLDDLETVDELDPDEELDDELGEDDDFGEADFEGGDDVEPDHEETEFGISGEDAKGLGLPPEILRKQRGEEFEAKQAALGKRVITIVVAVAILLVVLAGGGAALSFTPYGAFGRYYWEQFLPEHGDPRFVHEALVKAEKLSSSDRYSDVKRALKELSEVRKKAGINRELLTRSLMHEALFIVRFGDDPDSAARVAAIMKRLEERAFKAPGMDLALAADAARRRAWADVAAPLAAARQQAPKDAYVELLAGEVALAQGKLDEADKAFGKALQLGAATRAQWGLARVALARPEKEAQIAAVNETLKQSPMHIDARIAEANIAWQQGKEERAVHLLRVALGLEPTEDDQYLWGGKQSKAQGFGMLGYVHETRGRLHTAREAYGQALAADPYRIEALLGEGRVLLREKRPGDALPRFESALSAATKGGQNPTVMSGRKADAEAQLGISRALLALERGPEARIKLDELSKQLPNDPDLVLALGETDQALGNIANAEAQFRKAIELSPRRFDGYLALSQLFFKQGDAGKASEVLNEATAQVAENAEMRRMLGQSELARNRLESAIHEFRRALELDPHDTDAMFGLAVGLRKHGDLDEADKMLEQITTRDPAYGGLAEQRGLLFESRGEFAKAIEAYKGALEKEPADTELLLRLGAAQVAGNELDAAEQTLDKVIREVPNSAEAEYFIGRIAFARGRTPDALTHFDRAVSLDGTRGEFHLYVARASLEMGNLGRTLEEVAAAINFDSSLGDAYWVRAMVKLRMGAVKDSLKDLEKALKLNPARTEAYAVMGDCYEQLRQMSDAIRSYRTALERDPKRGEWWYRVAMLHADMGERAEADPAVKKAIELGDQADPVPYWLPDAYRVAGENAESRGDKGSAIKLYKRYLEVAPGTAIDRSQIEKRLKDWGVQLGEDT